MGNVEGCTPQCHGACSCGDEDPDPMLSNGARPERLDCFREEDLPMDKLQARTRPQYRVVPSVAALHGEPAPLRCSVSEGARREAVSRLMEDERSLLAPEWRRPRGNPDEPKAPAATLGRPNLSRSRQLRGGPFAEDCASRSAVESSAALVEPTTASLTTSLMPSPAPASRGPPLTANGDADEAMTGKMAIGGRDPRFYSGASPASVIHGARSTAPAEPISALLTTSVMPSPAPTSREPPLTPDVGAGEPRMRKMAINGQPWHVTPTTSASSGLASRLSSLGSDSPLHNAHRHLSVNLPSSQQTAIHHQTAGTSLTWNSHMAVPAQLQLQLHSSTRPFAGKVDSTTNGMAYNGYGKGEAPPHMCAPPLLEESFLSESDAPEAWVSPLVTSETATPETWTAPDRPKTLNMRPPQTRMGALRFSSTGLTPNGGAALQEVPEESEFQKHPLSNEVSLEEAVEESMLQRTSHALETVTRLVSTGAAEIVRRASAPPTLSA